MPSDDFSARWEAADPQTRADLLRARFRYDLEGFCRWCWPDRFDLPFNELHRSLFERSDCDDWQTRKANRATELDAVAAPRGFAKSTISSFAQVVHAIVYGTEAYVVLMSAGLSLSLSLSGDIRNVFMDEDSPLAELYGPFDVKGVVSEWRVSVNDAPSVGVHASSFGSRIRGVKHPDRGIRPTLVLIDDGEDPHLVRNPVQRDKWWSFLVKDVLKLGSRSGGIRVQVRGTVLHTDSMLARTMQRPGWRTELWQAIESWPERADLWEQCREIWTDLTLGDVREECARAFYEAHREEMNRGVKVLDPGSRDIYQLYEQIWGEGLPSFLQEMQNDPVDPNTALFVVDKMKRCRVAHDDRKGRVVIAADGRVVPVSELRLSCRWDPSTGAATGDYAAIAVLGRDKYGYTFVLDVWMRRASPSAQLNAAWTLAERWGLKRISLESNGFQDLVVEPFAREKAERQAKGEFWQLSIAEEPTSENKEGRIASLEPDVTNGWMQFSDLVPIEVLLQLQEFPTGGHDDGPDAIQWAWKMLGGRPVGMGQNRLQ